MVKGVNKQIIEVNHPDSIYFEKAVFYVKPEVRRLPSRLARREAERFIESTGCPKKRSFLSGKTVIYALIAVVMFAVILTLVK